MGISRLRRHGWELAVDARGGGIAGLYRGTEPILLGYARGEARELAMGEVLAPFPNRLRGGCYAGSDGGGCLRGFERRGADTIHAFVRELPWQVERDGCSALRASCRIGAAQGATWGYPYDLAIAVRYAIAPGGLAVAVRVANPGVRSAPAAIGFHPYLALRGSLDQARLRLPGRTVIGFPPAQDRLLLPAPAAAFRHRERIGARRLNQAISALERGDDGLARVILEEPAHGRVLCLWADTAFPFLQVYSADHLRHRPRRGLAVEPCTATAFAFNGDGMGACWLAPGAFIAARWGVERGDA